MKEGQSARSLCNFTECILGGGQGSEPGCIDFVPRLSPQKQNKTKQQQQQKKNQQKKSWEKKSLGMRLVSLGPIYLHILSPLSLIIILFVLASVYLKPHHPLQCASHSRTMFFVQLWCCFAIVTPDKRHYLRIMVLHAIVEVNPMLLFPIPYCCPQANSPHAVHHMLCHTQVEPVCKHSKTYTVKSNSHMTPLCV